MGNGSGCIAFSFSEALRELVEFNLLLFYWPSACFRIIGSGGFVRCKYIHTRTMMYEHTSILINRLGSCRWGGEEFLFIPLRYW